jgi:ssRNA-specific RNase YbeY (16S rRNA maturation enzyme)
MNIKSIDVLGLSYEVLELPVVNKTTPRWGEIDFEAQIIRIDAALSDDRKGLTLLHELLHGVCEALGYDEISDDEQKIQGIASALYLSLKPYVTF